MIKKINNKKRLGLIASLASIGVFFYFSKKSLESLKEIDMADPFEDDLGYDD